MPENELTQFINQESDIADLHQQIAALTAAINNTNQTSLNAEATVYSLRDGITAMQLEVSELREAIELIKSEIKEIRELVFSDRVFESLGDVQLGE